MVQMMERPPWASPFIRDTTWKQEALSRPLQVKGPCETPADPTPCPPPRHGLVCEPEPAASAGLGRGRGAPGLCTGPRAGGGKDGAGGAGMPPLRLQ